MKRMVINSSSRENCNTADTLNPVLAKLGKEGYRTGYTQLTDQAFNLYNCII